MEFLREINDALNQIAGLLQVLLRPYLTDPFFHVQWLLFVGTLLIAWLITRRLEAAQWELPGWRWQMGLSLFYFPVLALLAGQVLQAILALAGINVPLFQRLHSLLWLFLLYRGALTLVAYLLPRSVGVIRRRILLPFLIIAITLRLAGRLTAFLIVLDLKIPLVLGAQRFEVSPLQLLLGPVALGIILVIAQGLRTVLTEDVLPQVGMSTNRAYAIGTLTGYGVVAIGFIVTLALLGIAPSTLAFLSGAVAVGAGFGMQDTVNNLVSGFLIMFDPQINVGDMIEIEGERGVIRKIGIRNTLIVIWDGTQVVIPNATLAGASVLNLNRSARPTQVDMTVPVAIDADPHRVRETLLDVLQAHPDVADNIAPEVTLQQFAQGAMHYRVRFWVTSIARLNPATSEINLAIWERMQALGVELAPVTPPLRE